MPPRYIWTPSEIPPKCKLQRLEKERCGAEAEKFIAEFYRHEFIKPAPKNYQFNTSWISGPTFPDRIFAFIRSTPAPVHAPSRRPSSIRSRGSAVLPGIAGTFGRASTTTGGSVSSGSFRHSRSVLSPCARTHGSISECLASYGPLRSVLQRTVLADLQARTPRLFFQ
jgi:hypothetical protein